MSTTYTSKAIKIAATVFALLAVVFTSLSLTAPAASAATSKDNVISTNAPAFNDAHRGALVIKARSRTGMTAQAFISGEALVAKPMNNRQAVYKLGRDRFSDNKSVTVTVRIYRGDKAIAYKHFKVKDVPPPPAAKKSSGSSGGKKAADVAMNQVGDRYVWGASGPDRFDCSGLVKYAYKHATGKNLPHSSAALKHVGKKISRANTQRGDLAVSDGHVSIILEAGAGRVVEAATPKSGVRTSPMWQKGVTYVRP